MSVSVALRVRGGRLGVRACLVERIDRAIGAHAVRDVAIGERHRRRERLVGDRDVVVPLEPLAPRLQHRERIRGRQLASPTIFWKRRSSAGIAEHPALVFVVRRRADDAELAAHERGLEHVRRIHRHAHRRALTDEIVQLVDEEDDRADPPSTRSTIAVRRSSY